MPNIAIVGTEGSGKTVFITTLAKRLSTDNPTGVFMSPQGRKTVQYVEQVWHTLTNSEWPSSTSPGELFHLSWTIHWPDGLVGNLRLVDCAGQDLRMLFADEQASSQDLPAHLTQLAQYCRAADIMLLMVNLKDFIGESNEERRTANEWAIKYALDLWSQRGAAAQIAVVFTQIDQYLDVVQHHGGWKAVIKEYLPYVYGAHFRNGDVAALAVSAVTDTQIVTDGELPRRVPVRDFRSTGLNSMVEWIGTQIRAVTEAENQQKESEAVEAEIEAERQEKARKAELHAKHREKLLGPARWVAGFIGLMFAIKSCSWLSSHSPTAQTSLPPTIPVPVISGKQENDFGTNSGSIFGHEVRGQVDNRGASGRIAIHCKFMQAGYTYEEIETQLIPAGWNYTFKFYRTKNLWQYDGPVRTEVTAEAVQDQ